MGEEQRTGKPGAEQIELETVISHGAVAEIVTPSGVVRVGTTAQTLAPVEAVAPLAWDLLAAVAAEVVSGVGGAADKHL